jgi:hypothetical protein
MDTKTYAIEVAESAVNAFHRQARGDIPSPDGSEAARLFTAKGGSAVTLDSNTTSAAVVFDPEASLRNGQMNVVVYERNSSDAVTFVKKVDLGRAANEFLSVGVLSSGLKVFNSSGVDVIGGTQSSAVLNSVPKVISSVTTTDLGNFVPNHERDLVQGIVSREDATMTMSMTEHFGSKRCLSRTGVTANVVSRTWDEGIDSRRTTAGQSLTFTADQDLGILDVSLSSTQIASALATPDAAITVTGGTTRRVLMDTSRLDAANNPITLATYSATVSGYVSFLNAAQTDDNYRIVYKIVALDAADSIIAENIVEDRRNVVSAAFNSRVSGTVTSTTVPIARVAVLITDAGSELTLDVVSSPQTTFRVTCTEETADLSARSIHVSVFEGLNASATLNINSFAVLSGIPDSSNVFISPSSKGVSAVHDTNAVHMFLSSVARVMPRAFTISGHGSFVKSLSTMYGEEEVTLAFKALSFGDVTRRLTKAGETAKLTGKEMAELMKRIEPTARAVGEVASMVPGPVGDAAGLLIRGSDMMRSYSGR